MRYSTTIKTVSFAIICFLSCAGIAQEEDVHIVFLSGPKDHGFPGRHEYEKDLRVLDEAFQKAPGIGKVTTSFYVGKAPDAPEIASADVIVILSSSDRLESEVHPLFPPNPATNGRGYDDKTKVFLEGYNDLVKGGMGVVILHYANWAENWAARRYHLEWTGGLWVQMASKNPVDEWTMSPVNMTHPVLNGVKEWKYRDEIFCRFFLPEDYRRTDLIIGTPDSDYNGIGPQVAAWAYQREDGGRAFVFGGVDYHDNMLIEDYRRLLLNGIYWAAGGKVPVQGITSETPRDIKPYVAPARQPH